MTSSVFPPQKKPETPHRVLGPESDKSDKGSNDEREEGILSFLSRFSTLIAYHLEEDINKYK